MCQFRDAAEGLPCAMDFDVDRYLRQSNARFLASINSILERYNHPFEDDLLVSMETLTYDTPDGPKNWENVSTKEVKEWREKVLECNREGRRNAEMSKQQSSDFEQERSTVHQESPENSRVDTSDIDEASDAGKVSVRGKFGDVHFQNLYVGDRSIQEKAKVQVDMIVQVDCARKIPKWMTIAPQGLLEGLHLASPAQELIGNQAAVYREKGELSNECSSSRLLQLPFSDVSNSLDTITIPRHQLSPELSKTCCDSTLGDYQFADDECSFSNVTLADLYPAMVRILTRLIKRESRRRLLKYMFGYSRHKRWCSRRPKLNVTVDKIRGFRPLKQRQALLGIGGCRNEDIQDQTLGNENKELRDGKCSTDNFSGLVPYSYIDTDEIKMDYTDSSFGCHLVSAKGHEVSKVTGAPDVATMGGAFLAEDEIQTAVSLKNSKCKESKKLAYKCSSEYCFITSASSGSAALHLVKESKTRNIYFPYGDTSELCSSTWSSYGSSNTITPVTNCSPAKASNTLLINPEKRISEGPISFQCKHSFSSLFVKQSPSKMHQKCEDAFEELYYSLCPKEIQKPLTLTRPLSSSKNLEEKKLMKRHLSDSVRSSMRYDKEFDRIMSSCIVRLFQNFLGFRELQI
ncbi:LOW QUALITY PROTEIN: Holliday junction recognition protein [Falco biarmicus]|uniref:LOW QUALITY PROTEIN: Holliday junction recognition protein n=1 Tax=Falco biarmicus TaxID=345155 RepID=UPI0024BD452F|nr:LOW QUALITY PROTEIN: Holliday junction recognition protein [Falco biarmicus]